MFNSLRERPIPGRKNNKSKHEDHKNAHSENPEEGVETAKINYGAHRRHAKDFKLFPTGEPVNCLIRSNF